MLFRPGSPDGRSGRAAAGIASPARHGRPGSLEPCHEGADFAALHPDPRECIRAALAARADESARAAAPWCFLTHTHARLFDGNWTEVLAGFDSLPDDKEQARACYYAFARRCAAEILTWLDTWHGPQKTGAAG